MKLPEIKLSRIKVSEKIRKNLVPVGFFLILPLGILIGYFFSNIKGFLSNGLGNVTTPLNKVLYVAKVDGKGIPKAEWMKFLKTRYGNTAMRELADIYMVKAELKKAGIVVSEEDVNAEITKIEKQLAGQNLEELLKQQGRSLSDFRNDVYLRVGMQKLLSSGVMVTDAEISDYITAAATSLEGKTDDEKKAIARETITEQKLGDEINKWYSELQSKVKVDSYLD